MANAVLPRRRIGSYAEVATLLLALELMSTPIPAQGSRATLYQTGSIPLPVSLRGSRILDAHNVSGQGLLLAITAPPFLISIDRNGRVGAGEQSDTTALRFGHPVRVGWFRDTLWLADGSSGGLVLLGPDMRSVIRTVSAPDFGTGRLANTAILANGSVLAARMWTSGEYRQATRHATPILRFRATVVRPDTLVSLRYANSSLIIDDPYGNGRLTMGQPWADSDLWAISAKGDRVVVVEREVHAPRAAPTYGVRIFNDAGQLITAKRIRYVPLKLPGSVVQDFVTTVAEHVAAFFGNDAAARAEVRRALYRPWCYPPVVAVVAASDGSVWLERESVGPGRHWDVLEAGGHLTTVHAGHAVRVLDSDGAVVWAMRDPAAEEGSLELFGIAKDTTTTRRSAMPRPEH